MKRASGVLMHVSSLPGLYSEGSFGKEAYDWIDFLAESGFSCWQVLPFCLPDEYNSPYKSYSAFSLNPYFIDLPTLAKKGLITQSELDSARQRTPYSCEFDRLAKERIALLSLAASRVTDRSGVRAFIKDHPHTGAFCRFMALRDVNGQKEWQEWEIDEPSPEVLFAWEFMQYEFYTQWTALKAYANGKGISVIGDIPIYVALDSSDVRSNPGLFRLDGDNRPTFIAGVPPDYFAKDGQIWGNPLYDWDEMAKDGYKWWRERAAFMAELFDGVRIDHFRGLESYFAIPANESTAKNGKWIKGPGIELVNALKEAAPECFFIAEDLGDITPEVRELVDESGFPGMRVLQFGFLGDRNSPHLPHNYDNNCIAYTGTHDNNTLLGYVWELDNETRTLLLSYFGYKEDDWDKCYGDVLREMFMSHAGLLILPVQDLLLYGRDTRLNTPGSSDGNWSYRVTAAQLSLLDKDKFHRWNSLYGRI
jgi:4-alpha-glucanotransferase